MVFSFFQEKFLLSFPTKKICILRQTFAIVRLPLRNANKKTVQRKRGIRDTTLPGEAKRFANGRFFNKKQPISVGAWWGAAAAEVAEAQTMQVLTKK
jgi:hypothetical protein